jgi:phospho-N-acetylmuramoyl-pentapeptide-transferase
MSIAKIFILTFLAFVGAFWWAPILARKLTKWKLWKEPRKYTSDGHLIVTLKQIEKDHIVKTPRGGGLIIWVTISVLALLIFLINKIFNGVLDDLNFLSRTETWLPIFTLVVAGFIGLIDDILTAKGTGKYFAGGMGLKRRIIIVSAIGLVGALWFHFKLGWDTIHLPFLGDFYINGFYIPLFIVTMVGVFSSGVIDGIDGLSGGVFAPIFMMFGVIAFMRGQVDLSAFCAMVSGTLAVFLWFNAPPAKFYIGETGIIALTTTLTVIAFLTNTVLLLPLAGIMLVATTGSDIIQLLYRKYGIKKGWSLEKRKFFKAAPLHHHFQLKGMKDETVVMRYWIITGIACIASLMIYLLDKGL